MPLDRDLWFTGYCVCVGHPGPPWCLEPGSRELVVPHKDVGGISWGCGLLDLTSLIRGLQLCAHMGVDPNTIRTILPAEEAAIYLE